MFAHNILHTQTRHWITYLRPIQTGRNQRRGVREAREIRSFEVDIDKGILKINGEQVEEPVIVTLPGPEGWPLQRLFASSTDAPVECNRIDVVLNNKP